jgi:murein DD-endopeptidase MepM/ murein hydrolase activator NlpD
VRIASFRAATYLAARPAAPHRRVSVSLRRTLIVRFGSERGIPVGVAVMILLASVVSLQPGAKPVGAAQGPVTAPRIAIGGGTTGSGGVMEVDGAVSNPGSVEGGGGQPLVNDGTVYKPVAVDTTVADGQPLLVTYTVRPGDTLTGIASQYGVSMMTIWWANKLTTKDALHVGEKLVIPPVSGLVVTVNEGDTLESLAATFKVDGQSIIQVNGLSDPNLVLGQVLIMPGAQGAPIPTPTPTPTPKPKPAPRLATSSGTSRAPSAYTGGRLLWPVVGGNNFVSQSFHYGHYGLDIAGTFGTPVVAAGAGTVIFAGWKNNGGGYQVWIAHGSGIYTTYNHMSAITTASGRSVGRGTQVGRIGMTGDATGPHLHFEVWIGAIWNGGYRTNPLAYL